jgi:hypothetical protein
MQRKRRKRRTLIYVNNSGFHTTRRGHQFVIAILVLLISIACSIFVADRSGVYSVGTNSLPGISGSAPIDNPNR